MTTALVSFGANLVERNDDLSSILENVRSFLSDFKEIGPVEVSGRYRTPAWPPGSGPDFLNAALRFDTGLDAPALLQRLHGIEERLGRRRTVRWGPRVCDLDLLARGDAVLPDRATVARWMAMDDEQAGRVWPDELILPHPRLHRRGFVLVPLRDVAPDWTHPILGRTVAEMIAALGRDQTEGVVPM